MEIEQGLKELADGMIDSYESRVTTIHLLMSQALEALIAYRRESWEMVHEVRTNLSALQSLRRKDFDAMFQKTLARHRQLEQEAVQCITRFAEEERCIIERLRSLIAKPEKACELLQLKEDVLAHQKRREQDMVKLLKRYHIEQAELKTGLKKLLAKGDTLRIKDVKTMLKAIEIQQSEANQVVFSLIDDFDLMRDTILTQWHHLSEMEMRL